MEREWSFDREKLFVVMLAGAVILTVVLSGLIVADLSNAHKPVAAQLGPGGTAGNVGTDQSATDQGAAGGGTATPGAGGSAANNAAGGGGAAAGAKGGGAKSGSPTVACTTCGIQGHTLLVGSMITLTGPGRSKTMADAVNAWVQSTNRKGGVNGYTIQFDPRDDGGNADTGSSIFRAFAQDEKVFAVLGECAPISDEVNVKYVHDQQLVLVGECQSAPEAYLPPAPGVQSQGDFIWVTGPRPDQNGALGAKMMATEEGFNQGPVAIACLNESSTLPVCNYAVDWYKSHGVQIFGGGPHMEDITGNDYAQLIGQWRSAGIQHIHLVLEPGNSVRFLAQMDNASGYTPQMFQGLVIDDSVAAHPSAEGMFQGTPWTPLDQNTPVMQRMTSTLQAYYPNDSPDLYAQTGWANCLLFEHALQLMGGSVNKQNLINTLNSISNWDMGMGERENYSPSNHIGAAESSLLQLKGAGTPNWKLVGVKSAITL
jgi:ABC-type branched-subunit amino acid transport system substrate-binding protein